MNPSNIQNREIIYVAGHCGMVGSAIVRALLDKGVPQGCILTRARTELDLCNQLEVEEFFSKEKPTQVYLAAAKVGGIHANNTYPADFIYQNLLLQLNVIEAAFRAGVRKLLFLGSSCIYPKFAKQPITEDLLLSGALEPTNEPYAIAKIAGIKLCESYNKQYGKTHGVDYRAVMPTNLYGPGDNFHSENSHVIPGLIHRFHEAKIKNKNSVTIWGSGKPRREFLFVDDMAVACVHVMNLTKLAFNAATGPLNIHVNIGYGSDISIADLALMVSRVTGFSGEIKFDLTKPDGAPQKLLDSSRINELGWRAATNLEDGLTVAYKEYLAKTN